MGGKDIKETHNQKIDEERPASVTSVSLPIGTMIVCVLIPFLALLMGMYYSYHGNDIRAKIYFRLFVIGCILATIIYIVGVFTSYRF